MNRQYRHHLLELFKNIKWLLLFYDVLFTLIASLVFYVLYPVISFGGSNFKLHGWICFFIHFALGVVTQLTFRFVFKVYFQIWRYGGVSSYVRLISSDFIGLFVYLIIEFLFRRIPGYASINAILIIACEFASLLISVMVRMFYRFSYRYLTKDTKFGRFIVKAIKFLGHVNFDLITFEGLSKINIAIVGAGRTGVGLAEELLCNNNSLYSPKLFVDVVKEKCGRNIYDIPVILENNLSLSVIEKLGIKEIVIALPNLSTQDKNDLFKYYQKFGCKLKIYDFPLVSNSDRKALREFDIEELLFRKQIQLDTTLLFEYYTAKTILITGGGGSIGSEIARQIASFSPKSLILLDIYENGVYDLQQELKFKYKDKLAIFVEICSITNYKSLEKIFKKFQVDIVIHAAAHKHVPFMETNVIEAVENNIFGTNNILNLVDKYHVRRFMLVSTDKAVNPTNVMGATKRFCEINTFARAKSSSTTIYSATRFGNVLGSAGSVIPLFRKQIAAGGPVTITDKNIIRYFMTIPEASTLVLASGTMAKNGELFVLDMGEPVKIYELAKLMISLSGFVPEKDIEISEIGLRPGEKLYEELLIDSQTLTKTSNDLIYIEKDTVEESIKLLEIAANSGDDFLMKDALKKAVPTFSQKR